MRILNGLRDRVFVSADSKGLKYEMARKSKVEVEDWRILPGATPGVLAKECAGVRNGRRCASLLQRKSAKERGKECG